MSVSQRVLYQTDWSKHPGGWLPSSHWHWSDQDGGTIITDSMTNGMIASPYSPPTSNYAIEVEIQRLGYSELDGNAYGVVIGKTPQGGYICGVGVHVKPEHYFLGDLSASTEQGAFYIASDFARAPSRLDNGWHVYRVEVNASRIRFFFDSKLVAEVHDIVHVVPGQVGIYAIGAFIHLRHFAIFQI